MPRALVGRPLTVVALVRRHRWAVGAVLALVGVFVLGAVAVRFAPPGSNVATWWPAAGLAVGFLLATTPGRRSWWFVLGVVLCIGAANVYGGRTVPVGLGFGVANASEAAVVLWWMTRGGRRARLASMEDFWQFLSGAIIGAVTFGVIAGVNVAVGLQGSFLTTFYTTVAAHAAAVLVLAPLGIAAPTSRRATFALEDAVQWVLTIIVTFWVFRPDQPLPLAFLPIPALVWGALRLPLRTVALQLLLVGTAATMLTAAGGGPFSAAARTVGAEPQTIGALTQAFLLTAAITSLALAVSSHQRRTALGDLRSEVELSGTVIDTAETLIVVVDRRGIIERINTTAARLVGEREEDIVGRPVVDVFPLAHGRESLVEDFSDVEGGSVPDRDEQDWLTPLGTRRIVWLNHQLTDGFGRRTHVVKTGTDVTDERAARAFMEGVLESATATAIVGTDRRGLVTLFNRGAENLLGYPADEVVGKMRQIAFHDPEEIAARAEELGIEPTAEVLVHNVRTGTSTETRDWTYVRKDGGRRTVSLTVSGIRDSSGQFTGYLGVAEDVTKRRQAEVAISVALERERQAVERLQVLDRTKSDFVSSVSHELRTPLASVLGYTEMLEDGAAGALTPQQAALVQRVDRNGRRLLSLIEDLLMNARIEQGELALQRSRCDLGDITRQAWESVETTTQGRDLTRELRLPVVPVWVDGDRVALQRVVSNLLSNAVKFTPDGGKVSLVLEVEGEGEDAPWAVVRVSDTGIGIARSDLGRVFDRFYRTEEANERAIQGSGLGLSIARAVVDGHEGELTVESEHGVGSEFTVVLPVLEQTPAGVGSASLRRTGVAAEAPFEVMDD